MPRTKAMRSSFRAVASAPGAGLDARPLVGRPDHLVDAVLQLFLATRDGPRVDLAGRNLALERRERLVAVEDRPAQGTAPAGVALLDRRRQRPALEQFGGDQESPRQRVDAADVGVEQVGPAGALAAELRVEVEAAGREAAALEDLVQRQGQVLDGVGELVGVPAVLGIAAVGVDRA